MQILGVQGVGQAQHQGHVGIGPHRPPVRLEEIRHVVAHRAHADHVHAGIAPALELVAGGMIADAALVDLHVLHADAAEAHHQARVFAARPRWWVTRSSASATARPARGGR